MRIRTQVISLKLTEFFFNKAEFSYFFLFFSLIFMLKLDEPFGNQEILIISFLNSSDLGLGFSSFWLIF